MSQVKIDIELKLGLIESVRSNASNIRKDVIGKIKTMSRDTHMSEVLDIYCNASSWSFMYQPYVNVSGHITLGNICDTYGYTIEEIRESTMKGFIEYFDSVEEYLVKGMNSDDPLSIRSELKIINEKDANGCFQPPIQIKRILDDQNAEIRPLHPGDMLKEE